MMSLLKAQFCFVPFQARSEATEAPGRLDFCPALAGETPTAAETSTAWSQVLRGACGPRSCLTASGPASLESAAAGGWGASAHFRVPILAFMSTASEEEGESGESPPLRRSLS